MHRWGWEAKWVIMKSLPSQLWDIISPVRPGSTPGVSSHTDTSNTSGRHPGPMPGPPQLASLNAEVQRFYFTSLLNVWATKLIKTSLFISTFEASVDELLNPKLPHDAASSESECLKIIDEQPDWVGASATREWIGWSWRVKSLEWTCRLESTI